jgi:hypothetical protein
MPLYGIEGLVPALTAVDESNARVRTIYRLPSGELIELLQEPAGGASAAADVKLEQAAQDARLRANALAPAPPAPVWSGVRGEARLTLRAQDGAADVAELNGRLRLD